MDESTVRQALAAAECNVSHAAAALGISRQSLYRLMKRYGITLQRVAA